jgi:hypothetical protein
VRIEYGWSGICLKAGTLKELSGSSFQQVSLEVQMKQRIVAIALAAGLATASAAFAEPVKMSEAQLDNVAGGLADVSVNLTNVGNPTVTVNPTVTANPTISVSVLGG